MTEHRDNIEKLCLPPETTLRETLRFIDANSRQMALVIDEERRLLGVVTDGDVRRALLRGEGHDVLVKDIMNKTPKVARDGELRNILLRRMKDLDIHFLPKVDEQNRVVDIVRFAELALSQRRPNRVVIMAGGRGKRLGALTDECPKPMLKIGGKPILETIIELLTTFGFFDFTISVHYLKERIIDHFGNGASRGVSIDYLVEDTPLDTAGALGLLKLSGDAPFLVMNGDIYTDLDFGALLDTHESSGADATMCVREFSYQIPFGVVRREESGKLAGIEEKPRVAHWVNAGIYAFKPDVLSCIPLNSPFPMTSLFEELLRRGGTARTHIIDGLWIDVGRREDFERAETFF